MRDHRGTEHRCFVAVPHECAFLFLFSPPFNFNVIMPHCAPPPLPSLPPPPPLCGLSLPVKSSLSWLPEGYVQLFTRLVSFLFSFLVVLCSSSVGNCLLIAVALQWPTLLFVLTQAFLFPHTKTKQTFFCTRWVNVSWRQGPIFF